jgi:hypothetical protein
MSYPQPDKIEAEEKTKIEAEEKTPKHPPVHPGRNSFIIKTFILKVFGMKTLAGYNLAMSQ